VTDYIWCGARICESRNGTAVNRRYYNEGEAIPGSKAFLYYGPDQLGSVRDVHATSPVFSMAQAYDYDPYGDPTTPPATGPLTDFRFAGMLYHADSGLYLTQFRAYDPRTARWLSRDPIGELIDQPGADPDIAGEPIPRPTALAAVVPNVTKPLPSVSSYTVLAQSSDPSRSGFGGTAAVPDVRPLEPGIPSMSGGTNLYDYATNDPIYFVDRKGKNPVIAIILIIVILGNETLPLLEPPPSPGPSVQNPTWCPWSPLKKNP
jgi:RHS repeat-associated protein